MLVALYGVHGPAKRAAEFVEAAWEARTFNDAIHHTLIAMLINDSGSAAPGAERASKPLGSRGAHRSTSGILRI